MKGSFKLIFSLLFLCGNHLLAQITTNEYPLSFFSKTSAARTIGDEEITEFEKPNVKELIKLDKIDESLNKPWRFGKLIPTNLTLKNAGKWEVLPATSNSKWTLKLYSRDAISINLNFNRFKLSENAKLFIYNTDYSDVLGAITSKNNKVDGQFAIRPIQGEEIVLELIVPTVEIKNNELSIHEFIYGYKSVKEKTLKTFNSSGACNVNINCKEGDSWQDVKRAVAMITTSNNTRICTGTLLNNVRQDTIPYVLTASHCGVGANAVFIFNYESLACEPSVDGPLNNSINGALERARFVNSDFHLFELSSRPPLSYNVFYAGWSATGDAAQQSACIHHPVGDVKKIALNEDTIIESGFNNPNGSSHWMVRNWEIGTTQQASSGAPLFDLNQRVLGQLHGGDASCRFNGQDYFGKFSVSWDRDTSSSRQLKTWLDPDNTQQRVIDGLDPNKAVFQNDIQVLYIGGVPKYSCGSNISPFVVVKNIGSDVISSLKINYSIDNNPFNSITESVSIARHQLTRIDLPDLTVEGGLHSLEVNAFYNSAKTDQDSSNNIQIIQFETNDTPILVNLTIKTDDFGGETIWTIHSPEGTKLYDGGPYLNVDGGQTFTESLCLYDSCFQFTIIDEAEDGFNGQFGDGFVLITSVIGDTLLFENDHRTDSKTTDFCIPEVVVFLPEVKNNSLQLSVFPNPVNNGEQLKILLNSKAEQISYKLLDYSGKLVLSEENIISDNVSFPVGLRSGIYVLEVTDKRNGIVEYCKLLVK